MKTKLNKKNIIATLVAGFMVITGTYNAVVINSESHINGDVKFVKRLDEIYGVSKSGRMVAAAASWQKLPKMTPAEVKAFAPIAKKSASSSISYASTSSPSAPETVAAVQEDLNLTLVEVVNAKKWAKGLTSSQFSGNLSTSNGVIDSLTVNLPNETVSVSFTEMTGNVFSYEHGGEVYSGMMYQVDQSAYMVTLTNGPLEGTRMRFNGEVSAEKQQEIETNLAENHNVEVGTFGQAPAVDFQPEVMVENQAVEQNPEQNQQIQAQGFNFDQQAQQQQAM